jgi:L-rhamnose mutarotase
LLVKVRKLSNVVANLDDEEVQPHVVSPEELATVAEAQVDQNWKKAMEEEMSAIEENKTWKLCELPHGC